jgi:hypothetical protein
MSSWGAARAIRAASARKRARLSAVSRGNLALALGPPIGSAVFVEHVRTYDLVRVRERHRVDERWADSEDRNVPTTVDGRNRLDTIAQGSRDCARRLGDRLKDRVFAEIFPGLARGFIQDRGQRLGILRPPGEDELGRVFEATLTLLYRLLFLSYAEARELLPVREPAYRKISLERITVQVAEQVGTVAPELPERLKTFSETETTLYDRLTRLFTVIDKGDSAFNLPRHRGALFLTCPDANEDNRWRRIAQFLIEHKVPNRHLASAIASLARDRDQTSDDLIFVDYKSLEVRHFGSIHEDLLQCGLKVAEEDLASTTRNGRNIHVPLSEVRSLYPRRTGLRLAVRAGEVYLTGDNSKRKAAGAYYTPDPVVDYIVEHTVGPALEEKLRTLRPAEDLADELFDFKVLDPAMGSGHFLVATVDFLTNRLLDFLNRFPRNPVQSLLEKERRRILNDLADQGVTIDPERLSDINLLRRHILKHCVYGVDLDPLAVELAKVALWLDASPPGAPLSFLDHHLQCGDSLFGASPDVVPGPAGFDAVIGNPPYAGHKGDFDARPLARLFQVCRHYPNYATAFLELALRLLRARGRFGMIIPKSIQYVDSWRAARQMITTTHRLDRLVDVSRAFDGVLLEQTICVGARSAAADGYLAAVLSTDGLENHRRVPLSVCHGIDSLPAAVDQRSLRLYERICSLGPRLGEISRTSQALGYQAHLKKKVSGSMLPIFRGKHVRPLHIDPTDDRIDESFLFKNGETTYTRKVSEMLRPKVVSQNIVAHVTRPKPRIRVISAPDESGVLCLNTVSTTILTDDAASIWYVSLVLNSSLASWFYHEFVFCRAVRTMHFDHCYAGKLPIAIPTSARLAEARDVVEAARRVSPHGDRQQAIDDFVFSAYGLTSAETRFIHEYCHGAGSP